MKPIDSAALVDAVRATGGRLCVVEYYQYDSAMRFEFGGHVELGAGT